MNIAELEIEFAGEFEVDKDGEPEDVRELLILKGEKLNVEIRELEEMLDEECPDWRDGHTATPDGETIWPLVAIEEAA